MLILWQIHSKIAPIENTDLLDFSSSHFYEELYTSLVMTNTNPQAVIEWWVSVSTLTISLPTKCNIFSTWCHIFMGELFGESEISRGFVPWSSIITNKSCEDVLNSYDDVRHSTKKNKNCISHPKQKTKAHFFLKQNKTEALVEIKS